MLSDSSSPTSKCNPARPVKPPLTSFSLTRPQLLAVTDDVNQSKGDQDPAEWMPARTAYHCTYIRKHSNKLTL